KDRKANPQKGSYTSSLFESGINKVAQKVGEEAIELVIEAKDDNTELFLNESADLMYHYLVLLTAKGFSLNDVLGILKKRHTK
ncbi:MAG: phosphoribosyl-ATP diphosphatase, partial [Chryseolinea sp.]